MTKDYEPWPTKKLELPFGEMMAQVVKELTENGVEEIDIAFWLLLPQQRLGGRCAIEAMGSRQCNAVQACVREFMENVPAYVKRLENIRRVRDDEERLGANLHMMKCNLTDMTDLQRSVGLQLNEELGDLEHDTCEQILKLLMEN